MTADDRKLVVLSDDRDGVGDGRRCDSTTLHSPADVADETLGAADAVVVSGADGLARVRSATPSTPVLALAPDPTSDVATDPLVDAWVSELDAADETLRWLLARREAGAHRDVAEQPSRMEQLHAGTTRLAGVRSIDEAYRTAVGIADELLAVDHAVVGVVDGDWVEPVAASAATETGEYTRVRRGTGAAGAALETGESRIDTHVDHDVYGSALTVPVEAATVLQAVSTEPAGFDETDRTLAELLASHLEETVSRLRTDETLRAERDRLLALFENVPDAAVAYDYADGDPVVERVNTAFEETFGYDAERIVGESIDEYIVPPDPDTVDEAEELNELLREGENVRREVTRRTVDGDRHFILHVVPIRLDEANASGFAIYTDVTERREREATLRRQNDRLDEFSAIVSHDLRNPLSVAEGYLELAHETGEEAHLDRVGDALDRMDELVTGLLSLAREGRTVGETRTESLAALATDAWESVETGDAVLVVESDLTCEVDPNRLRELFENLFRNAVEHGTTAGQPAPDDAPLTVRVGDMEFRSADESGFYVEDDGVGFDDEALDRLFESGYTTAPDGTGLGLAITRHIAEAHGWAVRAMSGEDGGARFEFRLAE